jgi:ribosomal protein L11 methyltransferase
LTNWLEIKASFASAPPDWSLYTEVFDRHGIEETLQVDDPPTLTGYMAEVEGVDARVTELNLDLLENGAKNVEITLIPDQDWIENWKQFFSQRRVGRIIICPSWEKCEPEGDEIVLDLDPGQAFGTGDHPTTRLCLELMQGEVLEGKTVQDIGCGSGILAIAACKLGALDVIAIDTDAQSVQITKDNAIENGVELKAYKPEEWTEKGKADLILSNIISATLIRLAPEIHERLNLQGKWIVSGIIHQNWELVKDATEKLGFKLQIKKEEGEWVAATFHR